MTKWLSGRKVLTVILVIDGTVALWNGKLGGEQFVWLMLGCLAGHHLPEVLKAWRGNVTPGDQK